MCGIKREAKVQVYQWQQQLNLIEISIIKYKLHIKMGFWGFGGPKTPKPLL